MQMKTKVLEVEMGALKRLQAETAAELDALLPAILDKAFKGELVRPFCKSTVSARPVSHHKHRYLQALIVNIVDDTIIAAANSVCTRSPKLLDILRSPLNRQRL